MDTLSRKICFILLSVFMGLYANGQSLENAFEKISNIEGFEKADMSAEDYGYPKEIGVMRMTGHGNADPRDKMLAILSEVPSKLVLAEYIDERGKIDRWYMEDLENGDTVLMYVFVGKGGNDLVAQIFTGASRSDYHELAKKIKEGYK